MTGALDCVEPWIERHIVPKLLDPNAISQGARLVRLRSSSTPVLCDPFVYTHWATYWFGHLYELELQIFLEHTLRKGDSYIDIGTNYGHFAFLAGMLVGPTGTVQAFEPNPRLADLVRRHAKETISAQFSILQVGLGDVEGEFELQIPCNHSGGASLRGGVVSESDTETVMVPVTRGDSVLISPRPGNRTIVKVDVEGFEPNVVVGMREFIRNHAQAVILEVTPDWIGGPEGVARLFAQMAELDCEAWLVKARRGGSLAARRCKPEEILRQENVYFLKPGFENNCDWATIHS